jgi:hypothetical protein
LRLRSLTIILPAILVGGAVALAPVAAAADEPTPAPSGSSYTWTVEPATVDGPDGRVSLRHEIDPGQVVSDAIALTNFSSTAAEFAVYASDGVVTADGNFDIAPPDVAPSAAGTWVGISGEGVDGSRPRAEGGILVEVPAGGRVIVPLTIAVPADAPPGDHPAGVAAELVQAEGSAIQFSSRVGVRLHLRVTGDVVAALAATHVTASYVPSWNPFALGSVTLDYTLENTGNVRLGAVSESSLVAAFGTARTSTSVDRREILPGEAVAVHTEIPAWPLFLGWGEVTVTPSVVGEDEVLAPLTAAGGSFFVATVPWSQLALIALLVGGVLLVRWAMRRSARRVQERIAEAVAAAQASADGEASESASAGSEKPVDSLPTMR